MTEINQIMPALVYGDAIGNHAYELWRLLKSWGIQSTIYANYIDIRYAQAARPYAELKGNARNTLIYHYSIGSKITDYVLGLPDRVIPYYHNITPAAFFEGVNGPLARELAEGCEQLKRLAHYPYALAASEYNRLELLQVGFRNVDVVTYLVDFGRLDRGAKTDAATQLKKRFDSKGHKLLFVGRIAPNKCQHDLIHLIHYYRTFIDPEAELLLVGSNNHAGAYQLRLETLVNRYDLRDAVHFVGPVGTDDGLGAFYQLADAFVCMSEHEGFCVPIIEAMHFGLPVFAYDATGVPYTMGNSGVRFAEKRLDVVAEMIQKVLGDEQLRSDLVSQERKMLVHYQATIVADRFKTFLLEGNAQHFQRKTEEME